MIFRIKLCFFSFCIPIFFFGCKTKKPTAGEALSMVAAKFNANSSISYSVSYSIKFFSKEVPVKCDGNGKLVREKNDSLFGGYVWFSSVDSANNYERFYDLSKAYIINNNGKKINVYETHGKEKWSITGNVSSGEILNGFLRPDDLADQVKDSSNVLSITSDTLNKVLYWKVSIDYPDSKDEFSKMRRCYWINPEDSTIRKETFHAEFQGKTEEKEWIFGGIVFNKVNADEIQNEVQQKMATYEVENYIPPDADYYKLLANEQTAPNFEGFVFPTNKKVDLASLQGKIVILDFWYMSCINCIHAFPVIEKLNEMYKDSGVVVWGVNSIDTSSFAMKQLPDFRFKNKINYPVIMTKHSVDSLYNVQGYPTLYVINRKGKIAFSQLGFSSKLDSTLTMILRREIAH